MAAVTDYWLTFRIDSETINGATSGQRRKALYDEIARISGTWWIEPTSFVLFDSEMEIGPIASMLKAKIAPSHDLVLIRELNARRARLIGHADEPETLKAFMPYLTVV